MLASRHNSPISLSPYCQPRVIRDNVDYGQFCIRTNGKRGSIRLSQLARNSIYNQATESLSCVHVSLSINDSLEFVCVTGSLLCQVQFYV